MNEKLLKYFNNDEFIATVWQSKYAAEGEETPDDMHMRMAKEFARIRFKKDKSKSLNEWIIYFFDLFKDFKKIILQGRVSAGLGVDDAYRSLSNCLRLPPPQDSYSSIMKVDTMLVSSAKRGCGYGVGLSNIRPSGTKTSNAAKTSTGVIPFGERYSNSTNEVGQEGRRGACLEDLDIRHPDSPKWAIVKRDKTKYTGANISFKMWGDFIQAVKKDEDYILRFPVDIKDEDIENIVFGGYGYDLQSDLEYNKLYSFNSSSINGNLLHIKKVKAKELWDASIHTVWSSGCPGMQFWERIDNYDPSSVYTKYIIDGTNACGEQPMAVFDTCRLLVISLLRVIDKPFTINASLNEEYLYELAYTMLEVGDDLIDLEIEYIQRIINKIKEDPEEDNVKSIELELWTNVLEMAKNGRRIGCGITALADMLAAMNIKYDSQEAIDFVDKVMRIKFKAELNASIDLARKYGTFKGWSSELEKNGNDWYKFVEKEFPEEWNKMSKYGRRHINFSTIAPVGTTSIINKSIYYFNTSAGCEPQFGLYFFRNKKVENDIDPYDFIDEVGIKWKQYPVMMGAFKDWLKIKQNINDLDSLSKQELDKLYEISPWYNCIAENIDWKFRVKMQATLQKYITSAISSTINLPNNTEEKVISDIYMYAYENGLKGITCYRDGSKGGVLVHNNIKDVAFSQKDAVKRPIELDAEASIVTAKGEKFNVFIGLLENKPYEIFAIPGEFVKGKGKIVKRKKGEYEFIINNNNHKIITEGITDEQAALTRLVSTSLRHGTEVSFIVEQLNKTNGDITSFTKAMSRVLKRYIKDDTKSTIRCEECNSTNVVFKEGCLSCQDCGNSKC